MVKGRRVKAMAPKTCANGGNCYATNKRKYSTKNGNNFKNDSIVDHCITDYFKLQCSDQNDADYQDCDSKINIPLLINQNFEEEKLLMAVEANFRVLDETQKFSKPFSPSTPHRIQLNADETESKTVDQFVNKVAKADLTKNNINKKINFKLVKNNIPKTTTDHKVTEYFPIRRSVRKTKRTVLEEKQKNLEQLLRDGVEEGLKIHHFEGKGRGVVAEKPFNRGDFVVEYSGELLDVTQAKIREAKYAEDETTGCYMYYFKYLNQQYCIDATAESGRLGRLVNHSRNGNLVTRTIAVDGYPHLVLLAKDDITEGEEITYDYGDRSKESLKSHPWLAL